MGACSAALATPVPGRVNQALGCSRYPHPMVPCTALLFLSLLPRCNDPSLLPLFSASEPPPFCCSRSPSTTPLTHPLRIGMACTVRRRASPS